MQISQKKSEAWDSMYEKLVEYYKINGHTDVVREKHHTSIYNWINYQRRCRREQKGKYPQDVRMENFATFFPGLTAMTA